MTSLPISPTPRLYAKHPDDRWTPGSVFWATAAVLGLGVQAYGVVNNLRDPGNRRKWMLTENVMPSFGWDSVTGLPIDVRFGEVRRAALVCFLAWLPYHWTNKRRAA